MEIKEYEEFAQAFKKVEAICTEIMNKLAYKPDENEEDVDRYDFVIQTESPEYLRLFVREDDCVELYWWEEDDYDESTLVIPKEVFINENIDEWCEKILMEHRRKREEEQKRLEAEKEARERKLYEELKKKYEV